MPTDAWGIDDGWQTSDGRWQPANPDTIKTFRSLIGEPHPTPTRARTASRRQRRPPLPGASLGCHRPGVLPALTLGNRGRGPDRRSGSLDRRPRWVRRGAEPSGRPAPDHSEAGEPVLAVLP